MKTPWEKPQARELDIEQTTDPGKGKHLGADSCGSGLCIGWGGPS